MKKRNLKKKAAKIIFQNLVFSKTRSINLGRNALYLEKEHQLLTIKILNF